MPKGQVTKKSTVDLLAGFSVTPSATPSAAEVARQDRISATESNFKNFAEYIVNQAGGVETDALKSSLTSLATSRQRAVKAVKELPDSYFEQLVDAEDTAAVLPE